MTSSQLPSPWMTLVYWYVLCLFLFRILSFASPYCIILHTSSPHTQESIEKYVTVELGGSLCRGQIVIDWNGRGKKANSRIIEKSESVI